ncbi:MAG: hypothetical protein FWD48_04590 [Oscillospiraceae bacterium]|nr:hypothetical protein [Oscillospiraceae bacterium]
MNVQKPHDTNRASHHNTARTAAQETQKKETTLAADNTDKLEQATTSTYKPAYSKGMSKSEHRNIGGEDFRANAGKSARQLKNQAVTSMVSAQVNGQANKSGVVGKLNFGKTPEALNALRAAEATSAKHDDYWGVEATAERIFTFAKALAGGDDSKFQTLKNAFLEGFRQASGARGGNLPSISYQTRDRVLEMFNQWEGEINAKKAPPVPAEK